MRQLFIRDYSTNLHGTTIIHDKEGKECYLLVGKRGLRNDTLSVYSINGALLAEAKQLTLGLSPKFALYVEHHRIGTLGSGLSLFQKVTYIQGINWIIVGSLLTGRYHIFSRGHLVFSIQPVELSGDYYRALKVDKKYNEPLAILITNILDQWARRSNNESLLARLMRKNFNLNTSMPFHDSY